MGISVTSGAVTTFCAGFFLVFPEIVFFYKMGLLIMSTVFNSIVWAMCFFCAIVLLNISLPLFMYISGFVKILCINYTICYWLNRLHCGDQKVMMVICESISSAVHAANRRRKQQMECLPATMMLNWNQKSILPQVQPSRRLPKRRFDWFSAQRLVCEKVDKIYESSRPL